MPFLEGTLRHRLGLIIDEDLIILEAFLQQPGRPPEVDNLLHHHGLLPLQNQFTLVLGHLPVNRPRLCSL